VPITLVVVAGLATTAASSYTVSSVGGLGCSQSLNLMNSVGSHTSAQRLVLGRVWVPKSTVVLGWPRIANLNGHDRFIKFGIGVTPGSPVTLEVPPAARTTYALYFNSSATVVADGPKAVQFDPCSRKEGPFTVWTGGYLVSHPACVPLIVRVGSRMARVSLALGRGC
jgi:hypothetical protein